jgi:hypothetical protein
MKDFVENINIFTEFPTLNSRDWTHAEDPLNHIPKEALIVDFIGSRPGVRPKFKWKNGVQEDVARLLQCCNWKLAAQNRTIWKQKFWEAKARL